jgi:hypothetical protein
MIQQFYPKYRHREMKTYAHKLTCTQLFTALFKIAKKSIKYQMPIEWWMDNVWFIYKIEYCSILDVITNTQYSMDEPRTHYANFKKLVTW